MAMFYDGDDLPEEIKNFFERQANEADRHEMAHDDAEHRIIDLLGRLDKDDLETIMFLITTCGRNQHAAPYYTGQIRTELKYRFKVCPYHGIDHDEQLKETLSGDDPAPS